MKPLMTTLENNIKNINTGNGVLFETWGDFESPEPIVSIMDRHKEKESREVPESAVDKFLSFKDKREGMPLSIAVYDQQMAERYVELYDRLRKIYKNFLPGPVTLVSKSLSHAVRRIESENNNIGIRIPDY